MTKLKIGQNSKTQMWQNWKNLNARKLKDSKCDKTKKKNSKVDKTKQTKNGTKPKTLNNKSKKLKIGKKLKKSVKV